MRMAGDGELIVGGRAQDIPMPGWDGKPTLGIQTD